MIFLELLLNIIFHLLGIAIIGAAILIGFEVAHDEDRYIPVGITGCFFLLLAGGPFFGINAENIVWENFLSALLIPGIFAAIGIILLVIWKKDK